MPDPGAVTVDANFIAVEWGLLGLFGVVVTLLIPRADEHYRSFLETGSDRDHDHARRWALLTRVMPLILLAAILWLSLLGLHDAGLPFWSAGKNSLLLVIPTYAQLLFAIMVLVVVRHVPWRIGLLHPYYCDGGQQELRSKLGGEPDGRPPHSRPLGGRTIIRFINRSEEELQVYWISFRGERRAYERLSLHDDRVRPTYEHHLFAVATMAGDCCVACFVAEKYPSKAVIDDDLVKRAKEQELRPELHRLWPTELQGTADRARAGDRSHGH